MGVGGAIASDAASAFGHDMLTMGMHFNQRNWDLRHAKRRHQYETADLKAAGLNPLLSFDGSGSAVPSSPAPSFSGSLGVSQAYLQKENLKLAKRQTNADVKVKEATEKKINAETRNLDDTQREIGARILDYEDKQSLRLKEKELKEIQWKHYWSAIEELKKRVNLTNAQALKMAEEAKKLNYYNKRREYGHILMDDKRYGKWAQLLMFILNELRERGD